MSQLFTSGGQSIGVSASISVLPMNTQDWSPLGWTGWISLQSKGLSRVFSNTTVQKYQFFRRSAFFIVQLSHPYLTTGKTTALTRRTFVGKVMSLLFNMLSRLVIAFLPRSKRLLISWLQSPSAVILEPPQIKSVTVSIASLSISPSTYITFLKWKIIYMENRFEIAKGMGQERVDVGIKRQHNTSLWGWKCSLSWLYWSQYSVCMKFCKQWSLGETALRVYKDLSMLFFTIAWESTMNSKEKD